MADRIERCETCKFWDWLGNEPEPETDKGLCRRLPPVIPPTATALVEWHGPGDIPYGSLAAVYPITDQDDWCGEWQPIPAVEPMQ